MSMGYNDFLNIDKEMNQYKQGAMGNSFNFLEGLLKNSINNGMPNKGELLQSGMGNINRGTNNAIRRNNENMAGRGMLRSGVASAVNAGIANQGNEQVGNYQLGLDQMEQDYKQKAIMQLLGLNQFQGNQNMNLLNNATDNKQFYETFNENQRQFNSQLEQQEYGWGDFLGQLFGTVGGIAGGRLADKGLSKAGL